MVMKMVGEEYDGLSEEEKYERAVGEYKVRDRDTQVMPDESVEFHIPKEIPSCMARGKYKKDHMIEIRMERYIYASDYEMIGECDNGKWKVPYKVVENAIQEIKEKGPENYSSITNLLIDLAREEQKAEMERWKNDVEWDITDYNFRKEWYENLLNVDDIRGKITREGSLQLEFGVYDEQELCNAFIKLLNLLKSK